MPKDFFGFDLYVGDDVAINESVNNSFVHGTVKEISEYGVTVWYNSATQSGKVLKDSRDVIKRILKPEDLKLVKFTLGAEQ